MQKEWLALDSTLPFLENVTDRFLEVISASSPLGALSFVAAACSCGMLVLSARTGSGGDLLRPIAAYALALTAYFACCVDAAAIQSQAASSLATSAQHMR